jgi:hypothetical protein
MIYPFSYFKIILLSKIVFISINYKTPSKAGIGTTFGQLVCGTGSQMK